MGGACLKQRSAGAEAQKCRQLPVYLGITEYFGSKWLLLTSAQQTSSLSVYVLYLPLIIKH